MCGSVSLYAYADDALVAAILLVIIFEGGFMFLARKRIALSREEGHEEGIKVGHQQGHAQGHLEGRTQGHQEGRQEGHAQGIQEGRAATEAQLLPVIQELRERIRRLENGSSADANP